MAAAEKARLSLRESLKDFPLFRKIYIITLFMWNIAFLQIPAYVMLVFEFVWAVYLVWYKQKTDNAIFKLKFGLWIWAFLLISFTSMIINFSSTILYSFVMLLHVLICIFLFYGVHTEPKVKFKEEAFDIAKILIWLITAANVIGLFCLFFDFSFEWMWIKFTIYENRFTGVFVNPNLLGFSCCVAIFCCHMMTKTAFVADTGKAAPNRLLLAVCLATSVSSLLLCDSNASMVLFAAYVVICVVYEFFDERFRVTFKAMFKRIIILLFITVFFVLFALLFRTICQKGFSSVVSATSSVTSEIFSSDGDDVYEEAEKDANDRTVTFTHENTNIDSGRFNLYRESLNLFKISPIIGISNGNIVLYSQEYANGTLDYTYHNNDLHNGFLTILISTGVIGFIAFGIFGFRFAKHSAQNLFFRRRSFKDDAYPCMFAFLGAYLFYALFEKALLYDISFMVMFFWLIMGYTSCYVAKLEPLLETRYIFHRKRLKRMLL